MSENKKYTDEFDLMMKSILDEAREEVPEHVWKGVSAGLDKAARKKTAVLWWRRSAVGIAAAAAVVLGVFFTSDGSGELVTATGNGDMIAVMEPKNDFIENEAVEEGIVEDEVFIPSKVSLVAEAKKTVCETKTFEDEVHEADIIPESAYEAIAADGYRNEGVEDESVKPAEKKEEAEYFPEEWGDEEEVKKDRNIAIVLAGITGTNNALNQNRRAPMMRPSVTPAPSRTGVEETSTKSSYGIPLSFGVGVKFDISRRWSVGTGLNYTYLSRQFFGRYTKVADDGNIEGVTSSDIRNQQHYIGIPVNVFYDVVTNDKISFYAYAGGSVEKCVTDSYSLLNTSIRHKEKIDGVQLSANVGIGVEFMLGKYLGLYIDPSVRYYFENRNQPKSIRTVQPLMLGFEIGLRARL